MLVIAFGGPEGLDDIRPFLANVLRGRRVPPERVEEVARHYELFGGKSPLTAITRRQAEGLRRRLRADGIDLPVYVGMRNWHPLLADTLRAMARDGVRRAIGVICAAHRSYSSCTQYRQNVTDARGEIVGAGLADVGVTYVGDWHTSDGFIDANARHVGAAVDQLPAAVRDAGADRVHRAQHPGVDDRRGPVSRSADGVGPPGRGAGRARPTGRWCFRAGAAGRKTRGSGLTSAITCAPSARAGLAAAVLCPIGFLCDHIEVLYDLDHEAAEICREIGLPMARAEAVNDDPAFLDTMRDAVLETWRRYQRGIPLPLAPASAPERVEGPPPVAHRRRTRRADRAR